MPNWFYTMVTINGPQEALARLKMAHFKTHDFNGDQYLDFETIIPMPPAVLENRAINPPFNDSPDYWVNWCRANWGTTHSSRFAWDGPNDPPGRMSIYMATAWAPPQPVFEKLAQLYPECTFEAEGFDEMDYEATGPAYRWSSRQKETTQ